MSLIPSVCIVCLVPLEFGNIAQDGLCRRCSKKITFHHHYGTVIPPDSIDWAKAAKDALTEVDPSAYASDGPALTPDKIAEMWKEIQAIKADSQKKILNAFKLPTDHFLWEAELDTFKKANPFGVSDLPSDMFNCRCIDPFIPPPFWETPINGADVWLRNLEDLMDEHFDDTDPWLETYDADY